MNVKQTWTGSSVKKNAKEDSLEAADSNPARSITILKYRGKEYEKMEIQTRNLKGRKGEQEDIKFRLFNNGFGAERFVASLLVFTSFGLYNSGYAVRLCLSKPLRTSYTRETLGVIPRMPFGKVYKEIIIIDSYDN